MSPEDNTIERIIRDIQDSVAHIPSINWGGCAVFACYAYDLCKLLKIPCYIRVAGFGGEEVDPEDYVERNDGCSHAFLQSREVFWDAHIKSLSPMDLHPTPINGSVSRDLLWEIASREVWNPWFSRSNIPEIQRALAKVADIYVERFT